MATKRYNELLSAGLGTALRESNTGSCPGFHTHWLDKGYKPNGCPNCGKRGRLASEGPIFTNRGDSGRKPCLIGYGPAKLNLGHWHCLTCDLSFKWKDGKSYDCV
jgi:hypothetical protein